MDEIHLVCSHDERNPGRQQCGDLLVLGMLDDPPPLVPGVSGWDRIAPESDGRVRLRLGGEIVRTRTR
jgi:hypothetical protein